MTIWFSEEASANWISRSARARGRPRLYSDLAKETSLTLRTVFGLPLGVEERGFIVAYCLTESRVDDAGVVTKLVRQWSDNIDRFTADGAYDKTAAPMGMALYSLVLV